MAFCPNCGAKIPDGSKFCGVCGTKTSDIVSQETSDASPVISSVEDMTTSGEKKTVSIPKIPANKMKLIILGSMAVAAILILVIVINALSSMFTKSNAIVYLSDGKYELVSDISKDKTIEIASSRSSNGNMYNLLKFSPDGKYIYYYTKYDSSSNTGSLCKAEFGKLKERSSKNDNYIEIIATNVKVGFSLLDDGTLLYMNGDNTLYYYNGKEPVQIAKSVNSYYEDGGSRVAYETGDYSDGWTLYGVQLANIDDKIKLASDYSYISNANDLDNILYIKENDNWEESLYVIGFGKESQKLGENVSILSYSDGKTYFTAENETKLSLYDYVQDDYASSDAGLKEPSTDDFQIPTYRYDMVYGSGLSENDFDELYTTCTRDLYWYGESTWWSYSMQEALNRTWGDETDEIHAATKNFIDKFSGNANEDGYILVTDEVKNALKEINKYNNGDNGDWTWLWLCYNRHQTGTTTDRDAYNAAREAWNEARNRISLREALKDKENDFGLRTLCCYDRGTLNALNENVLDAWIYSGCILYNTVDMITDKPALENIGSIYDVRSMFSIECDAQNYIMSTSDSSVARMSQSAADAFADARDNGYATLYWVGTNVYLGSSDSSLFAAKISNGKVEGFSIITDDAQVCGYDDAVLYYASDIYSNNDYGYCDLYSCQNGSSTKLASDVITNYIAIYKDGNILAYTDRNGSRGFELSMVSPKGEKTVIGEDVTQHIRVDSSTLLYISDHDLYNYNGKAKEKIRDDADYVWSQNVMEASKILNPYMY